MAAMRLNGREWGGRILSDGIYTQTWKNLTPAEARRILIWNSLLGELLARRRGA